jgi:hypothetical protein
MTRVRIERGAGAGEPIHVWPPHGNAAPAEFVWRGRRYRVRALETDPGDGQGQGGTSRRFRVRTTSGLSCVLSQDVGGGAWRMARLVSSGGGR